MSAPLLFTKYHLPPVSPDRVLRPRLLSRLDGVLAPARRLALVSAPAGSGKTTLVRTWLERILDPTSRGSPDTLRAGWFSVDEADNDWVSFLNYLAAALQVACPDLDPKVFARLVPEESGRLSPSRSSLAGFINPLAELPGLTVLVMDDYHWISATAVHACMALLLDHLPEGVRLVIVTRADPLLPLSRLRARGQLVEVRESELRFDSLEAGEFLNSQMGLKLAPLQVETLATHTEGWAAGLQMAALALKSLPDSAEKTTEFVHSFSGSHRFILDYLMDEVFSGLPEETQSFLLDTGILDRFCAALCAAVRRNETTEVVEQRLRSLHTANLFLVPLDEERQWYRYHHLFAELLRNRLRQAASPARIMELQRRAASWFSARGLMEEGIQYALQAGDFEHAAGLVEGCAQATMSAGRQATVQRWLAALPPAVIVARPRLRIYQAWSQYIGGDSAGAMKLLDEVSQALEQLPDSADAERLRHELLSILAVSSLSAGEADRVIQLTQTILDRIPETEVNTRARVLFAQGMACGIVGDPRFLSLMNQAFDLARRANNFYLCANILFNEAFGLATFILQLRSAWQIYQKIIDLCTQGAGQSQGYPAGVGLIGQSGIAVEWNDLDIAARLLEQGMNLCQQGGITTVDFYALMTRARLAQARGDYAAASAALSEAARNGSIVSPQMTVVQIIQAQVRLCLAQGQAAAAARWARGEEWPVGPGLPTVMQEILGLTQAHVDLAQGRPEDTLARLEELIPQSESARRLAHVLEGKLLQALARHALHQNALEPLEQALSLGQPQGATRLYLEAGPAVHGLLIAYRARLGSLTSEADRLLDLLGQAAAANLPEPYPPAAPALVEQLTPRELDVLRLLYSGRSNREIASTLYLSLSAVKKYTGNIYGKLGVSSRAQAIVRARELRLL